MANDLRLKPGTYRLVRDVENPEPDRRFKEDWRRYPVWKAGWEFLVTEQSRSTDVDVDSIVSMTDEQREALRERLTYETIARVSHRWGHENIGPGNREQFEALAMNLEPCAESHEALFTRLMIGREYFVHWLVETGRLSHAQLERLWAQYEDDGVVNAEEYQNNPPQRPRFVIADVDAEIDRDLVRDLSKLAGHVTRIDEADGGYRAQCACTWESSTFTRRDGAVTAADAHRSNMKVQAL